LQGPYADSIFFCYQ